jgi:hypothetical protein
MTYLDTGVQGAKRQSMHTTSPRSLLLKLIEENPSMDEKELLDQYTKAVRDNYTYLDPIVEYWFANNYHSLMRQRQTPETREEKTARAIAVENVKETIKQRATRMVLLDLVQPNGKALRDCTGKDCTKFGGWLANIAKKVKPTEKVGDVLSESEVRKLMPKK